MIRELELLPLIKLVKVSELSGTCVLACGAAHNACRFLSHAKHVRLYSLAWGTSRNE
nr:MAG TPA: hypothetical protein [Caudoviricetes sp.]